MPILYRYLSQRGALQTLESLKIRVGRLASLNDPFDCAPHIVGCANVKERIIADHVSRELFRMRTSRLGVICFSRTWREPVLWSHYADSHRGIVLVVRQADSPALWRVRYNKARPMVPYAALFDDTHKDAATEAALESFRVKSPTWRYEKESRIISDLEKCEVSDGHYFTPLPAAAVVGAIIGLRCECSPEYVKKVYRKHGLTNAKVWRAIRSESGFSLDREEA